MLDNLQLDNLQSFMINLHNMKLPHLCKILKMKKREKMIVKNMLDMEQHQVTRKHSLLMTKCAKTSSEFSYLCLTLKTFYSSQWSTWLWSWNHQPFLEPWNGSCACDNITSNEINDNDDILNVLHVKTGICPMRALLGQYRVRLGISSISRR